MGKNSATNRLRKKKKEAQKIKEISRKDSEKSLLRDNIQVFEDLVNLIRYRFDIIEQISSLEESFAKYESIAFHGRKITEAMGYLSMVAYKKSLTEIPSAAAKGYNPKKVMTILMKTAQVDSVLPSPSIIRQANEEEKIKHDVKSVIEGQVDRRLNLDEIDKIYARFNEWNHEINPFKKVRNTYESQLLERKEQLQADILSLKSFLSKFVMTINGVGYFTVLWDEKDNQTKVIELAKVR